jgi:hypothetical protein
MDIADRDREMQHAPAGHRRERHRPGCVHDDLRAGRLRRDGTLGHPARHLFVQKGHATFADRALADVARLGSRPGPRLKPLLADPRHEVGQHGVKAAAGQSS